MKISTKFRKICAAVMAALIIIFSSFSTCVIEVKASADYATALIEALFGLWGFSNGFGSSGIGSSSSARADIVSDLIDKWTAGESLELDGGFTMQSMMTGTDFFEMIQYSLGILSAHSAYTLMNPVLDAFNLKSYKATGTVATASFVSDLQDVVALYQEDPEHFQNLLNNFYAFARGDTVLPDMSYDEMSTIFNGLATVLAVNSSPDITSNWFKTVDGSVYSDEYALLAMNQGTVSYDIIKTSYSTVVLDSNVKKEFMTSRSCLSFLHGTKTIFFFSDAPCKVNMTTYSADGTNNTQSFEFTFDSTLSTDDKPFYWLSIGLGGDASQTSIPSNVGLTGAKFRELVFSNYDYLFDAATGSLVGNFPGMTPEVATRMARFMETASIDSILDLYRRFLMITSAGTETAVDDLIDAIVEPGSVSGTDTTVVTGLLEQLVVAVKAIPTSLYDVFEVPLLNIKASIDSIPAAISELTDLVTTFPQLILDLTDAIETFPDAISKLGEDILTIPSTITLDLGDTLEDIREDTAAIADAVAGTEEPNNGHSNDFLVFLNSLLILILIILELLKIFIHCLGFIVSIFAIKPNTAFIPEDMLLGLNYIKSLVIPGIGMSVYDFMMGLVYIFIIFYAIRILRVNIDRIRLPGK